MAVMDKLEFEQFVNDFVSLFRQYAPRDTGNLADNAIQFRFINDNEAEVFVVYDIAPYIYYTDMPWVKPRGKKKQGPPKNPNQGWFEKAIKRVLKELAPKYGGKFR